MDTLPPPSATGSRDRRSWWSLALLLALIWGGSTLVQLGRDQAQGEAIRQAQPEGRITLYTTRTCSYCAAAKRWLAQERVPFTECRVDSDAGCAERFRQMGEPGVPVVQVDEDQFKLGFDADWLAQALLTPERPQR